MKKIISCSSVLFAVAMMVFSIYGVAQSNGKQSLVKKNKDSSMVVLELFTSQGCSSCPPADVVLSKYAIQNNPNSIPLAFHIDYWNYIGWKDPFSKAQYSERQREYAQIFNQSGVYTPQLVINGKYELVGTKESEIANLVAKEAAVSSNAVIKIISSNLIQNQLVIKFEVVGNSTNSKVNLALVKKKEFTKIKRGENSGLEQTSYNIVYDFKSLALNSAKKSGITFNFQSDWKPSDFMVVAYLQNKSTGAINTASKAEINL